MTRDTQRAAFHAITRKAPTLRDRCIDMLRTFGPLTADEVAEKLGKNVLSIRPRITELANDLIIIDTPDRRENGSGKQAIVWSMADDVPSMGFGNNYTDQLQA